MSTSLLYFDFDGSRGLECRLALHVAGVPFDDVRMARNQWPTLKLEQPFGAVPVLTVDGKQLPHCNAILRYIGQGHDLHPTDPWTAAEHDAVMASVEELRYKSPTGRGMTEDDKKAARQAFAAGWLMTWADAVSGLIQGPFLQGDTLCVADLKVYVILRSYLAGVYDHIPADVFAGHPKLLALHAAVDADPRVQAYFAG